MADLYVRSTDGNNADNGSTWALAKATLAGAAAIDAAGDTIWLSQVHAESSAATQTITLAGTRAAPTKVMAGNDAAAPPVFISIAARVITTGNSTISIAAAANGAAYFYGISFECGTGATNPALSLNTQTGSRIVYESCAFAVLTSSGGSLSAVSNSNGYTEWRNCTVKFGHTGLTINVGTSRAGMLHWSGGSFLSGTSTPAPASAGVFQGGGAGTVLAFIEDVDFSNFASGVHITSGIGFAAFVIRNCKMPSGWTGTLARIPPTSNGRIAMYNCSASSQNYRMWIETIQGSIRDETTVIRNGGASDATTPISWKLASSASCAFPSAFLVTDDIVFWCNAIGSPLTVDLHLVHDSATNLTDQDIWLELNYLSSSGTPIGTLVSDRSASAITTTVADQTTESVSWVTTGLAAPNTQKLSVTFTPQMRGFVVMKVILAKANKTVYLCPKVSVSSGALINRAQFQMPGSIRNNRFCSGAYINIMNTTRQEQVPGNNFILESTSTSPLTQDDANYFMAC